MNAVNLRSKNHVEWGAIGVGLVVFVLTFFFAKYYTEGDQAAYRGAYSIVPGIGLGDARDLYENRVSGSDYIHFLLVWFYSSFEVEKNLLMSIANGLLAAYAMKLFCQWGADLRISAAIVLTNFYMFVAYFAAERLKFGLLFLFLSLFYLESLLASAFFAVIALTSHLSVVFVGFGFWLLRAAAFLRNKGSEADRRLVALCAFALMAFAGWMLFAERAIIFGKIGTYLAQRGDVRWVEFIPCALLLTGACFYSKQRLDPLAKFAPVLLGIAAFGASRLNMLAYFVFLYYALGVRGGLNVGVLATSGYLAFKSVGFVLNVLKHGHGFPA